MMSRPRQNAILESAGAVIASFLKGRGFALAAPVTARFLTGAHGSSGVDVIIALEDPSEAPAARAAIYEHFPVNGGVDAVTVR
jgi:hypothetical protein